ncbi:ALP1-like protein [Tanacetum coccineum]|uniref:ALP1-like protein n=1 Tax=Tanacetum coccineum TaxID=301880 RepID=A0ABQ4XYM4_9ASTR
MSDSASGDSDVQDFKDLDMIFELARIDCMHWEWRNCPKAWHGQFGRAGANNDLTVLNNSPLFDDLLDGIDPVAPFECNGVTFEKGYYLADGIYPQWASFVKSFTVASSEKNVLYKRKQEGARKDIERAFGVLQGRWRIISQPARAWTINKLRRVMHTCIILHNMILEDQKRFEALLEGKREWPFLLPSVETEIEDWAFSLFYREAAGVNSVSSSSPCLAEDGDSGGGSGIQHMMLAKVKAELNGSGGKI